MIRRSSILIVLLAIAALIVSAWQLQRSSLRCADTNLGRFVRSVPGLGFNGSEALAIRNLRKIVRAETTYVSLAPGNAFGDLSELIGAGLLKQEYRDLILCYRFNVTVSNRAYTATATPVSDLAGRFGYYAGEDGVIRYSTPAGMAGEPVQ